MNRVAISQLEKHVREEAGEGETAWSEAGKAIGLEIWHIEKFHVVPWPKERTGSFYDGDSYIVLHVGSGLCVHGNILNDPFTQTYKKTPEAQSFSYDLHFWLGQNTTQDEAGTAAYKTVELDDCSSPHASCFLILWSCSPFTPVLHGKPVQYREVQGHESERFLSYFPRFICMQGGVASGFHHVSDPLPLNIRKLYRVTLSRKTGGHSNLVVREVPAVASSLVEGDTYVLDKGAHILQFNTKGSVGQERFKAAEFAHSLSSGRKGQSEVTVYGAFLPSS